MNGLTLSRFFYDSAARPPIESVLAPEEYAAGLIGWSSEVLGFDDAYSRNHNWGPRLILFLRPASHDHKAVVLDEHLRKALPREVAGYPTNFGPSPLGDQKAMRASESGPIKHFVQIERLDRYLTWFLGIESETALSQDRWLAMPEHNLRGFIAGEVFHDGVGELTTWRATLRFYPQVVWYRRLANLWRQIGAEEAFVARCAERGDILGAHLVAARIVEQLMRLCFLMERQYAPYSKWFGTAFMQLRCATQLSPLFAASLQHPSATEREEALVRAYSVVAALHNDLGILVRSAPRRHLPTSAGRAK